MENLTNEWKLFIHGLAEWSSFWTLTFSEGERTHDVTQAEAIFKWRRLVQSLNADLFRKRYTRIVGHSYFAYALSFEHHAKGTLHMHAVTDNYTNWELANKLWRRMAGIVKIKPVDDREKASAYVSKYVVKRQDLLCYVPDGLHVPRYKPLWYLQASGTLPAIVESNFRKI